MSLSRHLLTACCGSLLFCSALNAQQPTSSQSSATVPRLVNFSGKAADPQGKAISGIAGVTFAMYKDQYEGAPLWLENQNIQADAKGNYTVQLGATKPEGLPLDLFSSGDARWLGVRVNGGEEQPRVVLVSVPYALKALDAETLGGRPVSAFMVAPPSGSTGSKGSQQGSLAEQANEIICLSGTACKTGFVPLFSSNGGSAKVNNSIITQSGTTVGASSPGNTIVATMTGNTAQTAAVTGKATATGIGNTYGVAGYSSTGNGVGAFGQDKAGTGVYGTGAVGVFGTGSAYGFKTDSNVNQARTAGGWVKAMVYASGFGSGALYYCYNSTLSGAAATTPPCGFTIVKPFPFNNGDYIIDFGFQVDDRLFSLTPSYYTYPGKVCTFTNGGNCPSMASLGVNQAEVTFTDLAGNLADNKFYIVVY